MEGYRDCSSVGSCGVEWRAERARYGGRERVIFFIRE